MLYIVYFFILIIVFLIALFLIYRKKTYIDHYTVDGKKPCPYPNMTDEDLVEFERDTRY